MFTHTHRNVAISTYLRAGSYISLSALLLVSSITFAGENRENFENANPAQLFDRIEAEGPKALTNELAANQSAWNRVMSLIASGDEAWLGVAQMLRPYATGPAKTTLRIALEEALAAAPATTVSEFGDPTAILQQHPDLQDPDLREICGASARDDAAAATQSLERRMLAVKSMLSLGKFPSLDRTSMANLGICEKFLAASAQPSATDAAWHATSADRLVNPMAMARELAGSGVVPTLAKMAEDQGSWLSVLASVGSGKREWVMDGIVLTQQLDTPSRRAVSAALQHAFVNNGPTVLDSLGEDNQLLRSICGPSIEDAPKLAVASLSDRTRMAKHLAEMLNPSGPKTNYISHVEECVRLLRAVTDQAK